MSLYIFATMYISVHGRGQLFGDSHAQHASVSLGMLIVEATVLRFQSTARNSCAL